MRRASAPDTFEKAVDSPSTGLVTRIPSKLAAKVKEASASEAENVRFQDGVAKTAPGYERVVPTPSNLDSPANLIHQSQIEAGNEMDKQPAFVGTEGRVYRLRRGINELLDGKNGSGLAGPGEGGCTISAAAVGDSGVNSPNTANVAELIRWWAPDAVLLLGDLVYTGGNTYASGDDNGLPDYEALVGQYYFWGIGQYQGNFGVGPDVNIIFPTPGNHDHTDPLPQGFQDYLDFFRLPDPERHYNFKVGPVHFFAYHSYLAGEPDGINAASTQGVALQAALAASDCPWRIVYMHHPPYTSDPTHTPGLTDVRLPFKTWGASCVIAGHGHQFEHLLVDDVHYFVVGTGGNTLRPVVTPISGSQQSIAEFGALRITGNQDVIELSFHDVDNNELYAVTLDNPQTSSGICYIGDAVASDDSILSVAMANCPAPSLEIDKTWPLQLVATYANGDIQDVTNKSEWTSDDTGIMVVGGGQVRATGLGTAVITATFAGLSATCSVTGVASCVDFGLDVMIGLDLSESMNATFWSKTGSTFPASLTYEYTWILGPGGRKHRASHAVWSNNEVENSMLVRDGTRLERAKLAIGSLVDALDETDQLGLVAFNDESTLLQNLTTDHYLALSAAQTINTSGGGSNIGAALVDARVELLSSRHKTEAASLLIMITDGTRTIGMTQAEIATYTTAIKAEGTLIAWINILSSSAFVIHATAWASPGLYFDVADADSLLKTIAELPRFICTGSYGTPGFPGEGYT